MEEGKKSPCQDYVFLTPDRRQACVYAGGPAAGVLSNLLGLTSQWLQNGGLEGLTGEQQEKRELKRGGEKEIFSAFLTSVCQSGATEEDQALFDQILAQVGSGGTMTPIRLKMQAFGPIRALWEIAFSGLQGKLFLITGSTGEENHHFRRHLLRAVLPGHRRAGEPGRICGICLLGKMLPTVVDFEFSLGEEQYRFQRSGAGIRSRGSGRMEMRDEHPCSRGETGEQWELLASRAESRVREYAQRL